jgi:hypothetical protein
MARRLTHADLLKLIGEIDGISLRSVDAHAVAVVLRIGGREIELIRDAGVNISHNLTRIGIAECIAEPPNAGDERLREREETP